MAVSWAEAKARMDARRARDEDGGLKGPPSVPLSWRQADHQLKTRLKNLVMQVFGGSQLGSRRKLVLFSLVRGLHRPDDPPKKLDQLAMIVERGIDDRHHAMSLEEMANLFPEELRSIPRDDVVSAIVTVRKLWSHAAAARSKDRLLGIYREYKNANTPAFPVSEVFGRLYRVFE